MLEIRDLHVRYGGIQAVQGVSLTIPRGSIVTLIGANGAGKSSIIRSIAGLNKNVNGEILLTRHEGETPSSLMGLKLKIWCGGAFHSLLRGGASCLI